MPPTRQRTIFSDWNGIADSLIGGIAHALSNRVATLGALGELMRMDGDASEGATMLKQEAGRFEAIVASLRLLGNEAGVSAEALDVRELIDQALALHKFHRDLRDVEIAVETDERVPPVRVERRRAIHALVVLMAVVASAAAAREQSVRAHLAGDDESVRLSLTVSDGEDPASESSGLIDGARELIAASGGDVVADGQAIVLEIPALGAVRAKERAAL